MSGVDDGSGGGIQLVGRSVRGPKHEADGRPCQDAWWGYRLAGSRVVIAVGDGLGSADHSQQGAKRATRAAASSLRDHLTSGGTIDRTAIEGALAGAYARARTGIDERAAELGVPRRELATTLLVLVAGPKGAAAAAVGAGGVVGHRDGEHFPLVAPEETEYANVTTPVTSSRWRDAYRWRYHEPVEAAAVFSDGLGPFAWESDGGLVPRRRFFDQVFGFARSVASPSVAHQELEGFLNDDHFRRYSGDDKTLVVGRVVASDVRTRIEIGRQQADRVRDTLGGADETG